MRIYTHLYLCVCDNLTYECLHTHGLDVLLYAYACTCTTNTLHTKTQSVHKHIFLYYLIYICFAHYSMYIFFQYIIMFITCNFKFTILVQKQISETWRKQLISIFWGFLENYCGLMKHILTSMSTYHILL